MVRGMAYLFWILAIVYLLFPWDALPDMIPFWGRLDDLIVFYFAWRYYRRWVGRKSGENAGGYPGDERQGNENDTSDKRQEKQKSPWEVLELSPGASDEEIKEAYRRLAAQYHPDKVMHLGEEFRQLAEKKFREIQSAYDALKKNRA
jgi:uncharacterized membrane protein YkvA (DUF1232 family)